MKMFLAVTLAKAGVQSIKLDSGFPPSGTSAGMTKLQTSAGWINKKEYFCLLVAKTDNDTKYMHLDR
jgi:hypothetical protein